MGQQPPQPRTTPSPGHSPRPPHVSQAPRDKAPCYQAPGDISAPTQPLSAGPEYTWQSSHKPLPRPHRCQLLLRPADGTVLQDGQVTNSGAEDSHNKGRSEHDSITPATCCGSTQTTLITDPVIITDIVPVTTFLGAPSSRQKQSEAANKSRA